MEKKLLITFCILLKISITLGRKAWCEPIQSLNNTSFLTTNQEKAYFDLSQFFKGENLTFSLNNIKEDNPSYVIRNKLGNYYLS